MPRPEPGRGPFNIANALGAWLGGLAIAAGLGWTSTGWLGALLAGGGLLILIFSLALERKAQRQLPERAFEI